MLWCGSCQIWDTHDSSPTIASETVQDISVFLQRGRAARPFRTVRPKFLGLPVGEPTLQHRAG